MRVVVGWRARPMESYRRPLPHGAAVQDIKDWQILVLSLQHIMHCDVHVGGATALGLQGYTHYLRLGDEAPVFLYGDDLPGWTSRVSTSAKLILRSKKLFKDGALGLDGLHGEDDDARPMPWWKWPLIRSTPERAILEALNELPNTESFHMLDMAFESLTTLRPRKLTALFASCASVKVKRLFFVFADRHAHAWRKHINPETAGLGTGDRALVKGGKLHPTYRITIPSEYVSRKSETAHGT